MSQTEERKLLDTSLEKILLFNKNTIEKAKQLPHMMQTNVLAIKPKYEMHLHNAY